MQSSKSHTAVTSRPVTHHLPRQQLGLPWFHRTQQSESTVFCRASSDGAQITDSKQRLSIDLEPQAEGDYCMPGEVFLDNESHEQFTILRVEVKDYPGLLRVIAWVVNGLELIVQNAR